MIWQCLDSAGPAIDDQCMIMLDREVAVTARFEIAAGDVSKGLKQIRRLLMKSEFLFVEKFVMKTWIEFE